MKATEFCEFFDFTIMKEKGYVNEDFYEGTYNYIGVDNQGCFHNRYAEEIIEIVDWFDSLLTDYVDESLEMRGFEYDKKSEKGYYEQADEFIKDTPEFEYGYLSEVVECLINPELIQNDLL